MLPDTSRLLAGARQTLASVVARLEDAEAVAALRDVELVLNELQLRGNRRFYLDHYRDGLTLAREGAALLADSDTRESQRAVLSIDGIAPDMDPRFSADAIGAGHASLRRAMEPIVRVLANVLPANAAIAAYLDAVVD